MEPLNNPNTVINNSEASDANNNALLSYPWWEWYAQQEVTPLPHMTHLPLEDTQDAASAVVGENFPDSIRLTQADINILLDKIIESNHQCAIAQEEVHRVRMYAETTEAELRESRQETERAYQLLNQTHAQVTRL